jgi:hypothetical protein
MVAGGGIEIRGDVVPAAGPVDAPAETPTLRVETIWEPPAPEPAPFPAMR